MLASGVGRGLGVFAKDYGTEADLLDGVQDALLGAEGQRQRREHQRHDRAALRRAGAGSTSVVAELAKAGANARRQRTSRDRTPVDVALGVGGRGRAGGPPPIHTATAGPDQEADRRTPE